VSFFIGEDNSVNTFKKCLLGSAGLVVLSLVVMSSGLAQVFPQAASAAPAGPTVTVDNTSSNPVPVVAQGSTTVAGNVTVSNGASNPVPVAGNVAVSNARTSPVPVVAVDNPARQPFQFSRSLTFSPATGQTSCAGPCFSVPAGKRMVIEFVSVIAEVGSGEKVLSLEIVQFPISQSSIVHFLPPVFVGTNNPFQNNSDMFLISQKIKMYLDASTGADIEVFKNVSTSNGSISANLSGYLIDVP
jgi:hypothetical protein